MQQTQEVDDFTSSIIKRTTVKEVCTPGPKYSTTSVGIGVSAPAAFLLIVMFLSGAGTENDAYILVSVAYLDLATDVLYTLTEDFDNLSLFWSSFASIAIVPVVPFILTLRGEPRLLLLTPRGLASAGERALGEKWANLERFMYT